MKRWFFVLALYFVGFVFPAAAVENVLLMRECVDNPRAMPYYRSSGPEVQWLGKNESISPAPVDMCAEVEFSEFDGVIGLVKIRKGTRMVYKNSSIPVRLAAGGYRILQGWEPIWNPPAAAIDPPQHVLPASATSRR